MSLSNMLEKTELKEIIKPILPEKGEFNLASVLSDLNNKPVKFSFSYDEDYTEPEVDEETGEVI